MKYARVSNSLVQETFVPPIGVSIDECFHPSLRVQFENVPDNVEEGWVKHQDGSFTAPVPPSIPVTDTGAQ